LGWSTYIQSHQSPSSINLTIHNICHPTAQYLQRVACSGVPALSSCPPWSLTKKLQTIQRGPHVSASRQYADFLFAYLYDYVQIGHWAVLPASAILHHLQLQLSPAGVVPQCERQPRPIMDYTFSGVNQSSIPLFPKQAMQFGKTLQRLLQRIVYLTLSLAPHCWPRLI